MDTQPQSDVMRWRKAERQRLIEERLAIDAGQRRYYADRISAALNEAIGDISGRTVSLYWPIRGEADLRPWVEQVRARGGICALPVAIKVGMPLTFRAWYPDTPLERGLWNIPTPVDSTKVTPDVVIAPVVGFDRECYRLGYGGGFFDRTLAAMHRARIIGVGYGCAEISTIRPQAHDIRMDMIVTERGTLRPTL
jgi:5-formyltetrahydrofolate cyclo-ligase